MLARGLLRTRLHQGLPWLGTQHSLVLGKPLPSPALPAPRVLYGQEGPLAVQRLMSPQAGLLTVHALLRGTAIWAEVTSFLPQKGFGKAGKTLSGLQTAVRSLQKKGSPFSLFAGLVEQKQAQGT